MNNELQLTITNAIRLSRTRYVHARSLPGTHSVRNGLRPWCQRLSYQALLTVRRFRQLQQTTNTLRPRELARSKELKAILQLQTNGRRCSAQQVGSSQGAESRNVRPEHSSNCSCVQEAEGGGECPLSKLSKAWPLDVRMQIFCSYL
jgi:hypothetical protein